MKSWKEIPHLFCNGKFEVQNDGSDDLIQGKLFGVLDDRLFFGNLPFERKAKHCSLIARPISDMSDEERRKYNYKHGAYFTSTTDSGKTIEKFYKTPESFLYLLSIGVYPFDQDNPKDVIWRKENE